MGKLTGTKPQQIINHECILWMCYLKLSTKIYNMKCTWWSLYWVSGWVLHMAKINRDNNTGLMGRPNGWWYCDGNIHKSIDGYINHLVCNHLSAEMFWGRIDICICLIFSHFLITGKHWRYWPFVRGIHWSGITFVGIGESTGGQWIPLTKGQ